MVRFKSSNLFFIGFFIIFGSEAFTQNLQGIPMASAPSAILKPLGVDFKDFGSVETNSSRESLDGEFEIHCGYCASNQYVYVNSLTSSNMNFYISNDQCTGRSIYGSDVCRFRVTFSPQTSGTFSGTINLVANNGTANLSWPLKGVGVTTPTPPTPPSSPNTGSATPRVETPICAIGSVVDVDNLVLGEDIPIVGSAFTLHYASDRVPGRSDLFVDQNISIPVYPGATSATFEMYRFPGNVSTVLNATFTPGQTAPTIIKHTFDGFDGSNVSLLEDKNLSWSGFVTYSNNGSKFIFGNYGGWQARSVGLGGWNLSQHHYLGSSDTRIYFGYGGSRYLPEIAYYTSNNLRAIASADGSEVYLFDALTHTHIKTKDAYTGSDKYVFSYHPNTSKLASVTDAWGRVTTFIRDTNGNISGIQTPNGQISTLTLDTNGWLKKVTDPIGRSFEMTYNAKGLLGTFKKPNGQISSIIYNSDGTLKSDSGAFGTLVDLTKTILPTGWKIEVKSAMNRTSAHTVSTNGQDFDRASLKSDGTTTTVSSKPTGESVYNFPEGYTQTVQMAKDSRLKWSASYPSVASMFISRSRLSTTASTSVTNVLSDPNDIFSLFSKTTTTTLQGDSTQVWNTVYTATNKQFVTTSPMGVYSWVNIDAKGKPIAYNPGNGTTFSFTYDTLGRLVNEQIAGRSPINLTTRTYDSYGNVATIADAQGNITSFTYDLAGRITKQTAPTLEEVIYTYDDNDNLTSVKPSGRPTHNFVYNALNFIASYLPPSLGGTPPPKTFTYNTDRQLTKIENPDSTAVNLTYGSTSGLLTNVSSSEGNYTYSYFPISGQLSITTSPYLISNERTYIGPLPISNKMSYNGTLIGSVDIEYSSDMKVSKIQNKTVNSTFDIPFTLNKDGMPTQIGSERISYDPGSNKILSLNIGNLHDDLGQSRTGLPGYVFSFFNGNSTVSYNPIRRFDEKVVAVEIFNFNTYIFKNYLYDNSGRLTGSTDENDLPISNYVYDTNGNRTSSTFNSTTYSSTYNNQDQMLTFGPIQYSYNTNGERQTRTQAGVITQYAYDSIGNLKTVTTPSNTISYIYDSRNRRVGKKRNGVVVNWWLYYDQTRVAALLDGSGQRIASYVYGVKANTPDYISDQTGNKYRIVSDVAGSPISMINVITGANYDKFTYTDFGIPDHSQNLLPISFAGGIYDSDTKLLHFGARDYDPEAGVWLQKDPIAFAGGDTNLYRYVTNDPINLVDPSGLKTTIYLYPGAFGLNHIGVAVGNDPSIGNYPGGFYYDQVDQGKTPLDSVTLNTTPEQEDKIRKSLYQGQGYGLTTNNCAQTVNQSLCDGGAKCGSRYSPNVLLPNKYINFLKEK